MRSLFGIALIALVICSCDKEPASYDYRDMIGTWVYDEDITLIVSSVDPVEATFKEFDQDPPDLVHAYTADSTLYLSYKREYNREDPDIWWSLYVEIECQVIAPNEMEAKVTPGTDYHDGKGIQWMESRCWLFIKQ
jgi:hypothetical protein